MGPPLLWELGEVKATHSLRLQEAESQDRPKRRKELLNQQPWRGGGAWEARETQRCFLVLSKAVA